MSNKQFFLAVLLASTCMFPSWAQDTGPGTLFINQKTRGAFLTFGVPYNTLPEGNKYYPLVFGGSFYFPFYSTKRIFNIGADLVPNAAVVLVGEIEFEAGFNVGVLLNFALSPRDILRFRVGAGPHFISVETRRQAKGFAFSDNFFAEYLRKLEDNSRSFYFGIDAGLRHISNAGLKLPNVGIDDIMLGVRVGKILN